MIYSNATAVGIDSAIKDLQKVLHNDLLALWELDGEKYDCYGRAYRNPVKTGTVPNVFKGGNEYGEPLPNDSKVVTSFFGIPASTKIDRGQSVGAAHLIFFVNLAGIKPQKYANATHRIDEEIRQDVLFVLNTYRYLCKTIGVDLWPENVLREYTSYRTNDAMKARDMHPFHMFRVNLEIRYTNSNC